MNKKMKKKTNNNIDKQKPNQTLLGVKIPAVKLLLFLPKRRFLEVEGEGRDVVGVRVRRREGSLLYCFTSVSV